MVEIIVVRERTVHKYRTTWANLRLTAEHVGKIWETETVSVYSGGQPYCTVFTDYGLEDSEYRRERICRI